MLNVTERYLHSFLLTVQVQHTKIQYRCHNTVTEDTVHTQYCHVRFSTDTALTVQHRNTIHWQYTYNSSRCSTDVTVQVQGHSTAQYGTVTYKTCAPRLTNESYNINNLNKLTFNYNLTFERVMESNHLQTLQKTSYQGARTITKN